MSGVLLGAAVFVGGGGVVVSEELSVVEARALADRRLRDASRVLDRLVSCKKEASSLRAENQRLRIELQVLRDRITDGRAEG